MGGGCACRCTCVLRGEVRSRRGRESRGRARARKGEERQRETERGARCQGRGWQKKATTSQSAAAGRLVSDAEVDRRIAQGGASGGPLRAFLSELVLPDDGKSDPMALAVKIRAKMKTPTDFSNAARIFSKGRTAANGGTLGWIDTTTLPPQVAQALIGLKSGEISGRNQDFHVATCAAASRFLRPPADPAPRWARPG